MERQYLPEGMLINTEHNKKNVASLGALRNAMEKGEIVEGRVVLCDAAHNLIVKLGSFTGMVKRNDAALGLEEGSVREIAVISRVGKPIAVTITDIEAQDGEVKISLSRRAAQERAQAYMLDSLSPGDVIPARITHLEPFGAFVDIGCGIVSLIGIENISVSRISHPRDRFYIGQDIYAVVSDVNYYEKRIMLTHRELLGTWQENAARFETGQTVRGIVRGIEEYGIFIELAPNLSGLAEKREDLREGDVVSVFIKNITEEKMKIKLIVIDRIIEEKSCDELCYFIKSGKLSRWDYSPQSCERKSIYTVFK